ncbi:hypothetical protein L1987_73906 [Smallanthus sonchifolius]|uniref:Uncharacterized protein n=1 Tax=Smallanthus sonchifolius TaxID=185202 RepID=A0ACB9A0S7_9ASTR|nr:hypothetical protein L1987_73906 [Smallanthus sonchifolius]
MLHHATTRSLLIDPEADAAAASTTVAVDLRLTPPAAARPPLKGTQPLVYPLFAALGVAVGICGMQLVRNISGNPEVRVICL